MIKFSPFIPAAVQKRSLSCLPKDELFTPRRSQSAIKAPRFEGAKVCALSPVPATRNRRASLRKAIPLRRVATSDASLKPHVRPKTTVAQLPSTSKDIKEEGTANRTPLEPTEMLKSCPAIIMGCFFFKVSARTRSDPPPLPPPRRFFPDAIAVALPLHTSRSPPELPDRSLFTAHESETAGQSI